MLEGRFKDNIQRMLAASEGGKATDTATVAQSLLKLAVTDVPFGHTEYIGVPHWDESKVKEVLDLYDDTSRKISKMVFAQPDLSFGHYILKKPDLYPVSTVANGKLVITTAEQRAKDPSLPDGVFTIDEEDVGGHFAGEKTPKIEPLWKTFAATVSVAEGIFSNLSGHHYYLESVRGIKAHRMILPGDTVAVYLRPSLVGKAGLTIVDLAAELKVNDTIVTTIDSLMLHAGKDPNDHLKPLFLEVAALANGLDALHQNPREGVVPLFKGVESIEYAHPEAFGIAIPEGTELVIQSRLDSNTEKEFVGQSITRIGSERFATTLGLRCGFEDRERAIAFYNALVLRRQRQQERRSRKEEA